MMPKKILLKWLQEKDITIPGALLTQYKAMNLKEEEVVLILHLISISDKGNDFPTPFELAEVMTYSAEDCAGMLRRLIQKGLITINEGYSEEGIRFEKYCLDSFWEKLADAFLIADKRKEAKENQQDEIDLYSVFESEFGRPLSPFECETLALWLDDDHHEVKIIKAALKEAVISGKLNFRYIDRILFEWKKNGIKTVEQATNQGKKFRQNQVKRMKSVENSDKRNESLPFYNWLEQ